MATTRRVQRVKKRRLTDEDAVRIGSLIKGQPSNRPMTWHGVVRLVESSLGHRWTRQTLQAHEKVKGAYDEHARRYQEFRSSGKISRAKAPEIVVLQQKLDGEQAENAALRETLRKYDELFCTYLQNAIRHGLSPEQLGAPLVAPFRGQTGWAKRRTKAKGKKT